MTQEDEEWERNCGLFPNLRKQREEQECVQDSNVPTMRNTPTPSVEAVSTPEWNVTDGRGKSALELLISHEDLKAARAENDRK